MKSQMLLFWFGMMLTLIGGLLSNEIIYKRTIHYLPIIRKKYISYFLLFSFLIGIVIQIFEEYNDQKKQKRDSILYEYATYNAKGNSAGKIGGVHIVRTPFNDWNSGFYITENDTFRIACNYTSLNICDSIIELYPYFPFPYYFKAICLKQVNDRSWKRYAKKAGKILVFTSELPNHHKDHEKFLKYLQELQEPTISD